MTKQKREDLEAAEALLKNGSDGLAYDQRALIRRCIESWKEAEARLSCVTLTVKTGLPSIDEAVRKYGCPDPHCGTPRCPNGWRCQAGTLAEIAGRLRDCLEGDIHG